MKTHTSIITTIFLFLTLSSWGQSPHAQENSAKSTISYKEFMEKIRASIPHIRKNSLAVKRAENAKRAGESPFDTRLESSASWNKTWKYSYNPFSRTGYETEYAGSLGITKKLYSTGSVLSGGISYRQYQSDIDYGSLTIPDTYYYPAYYAGFSQSLLKNSFGAIDRFASKDAEMKEEIEQLRASQNDDNDLNYYRKLYFDWLESIERLELFKKTIDDAVKLKERVNNKFRLGMAENDDVQNAAAAELQYRAAYEEESSAVKSLEEEIGLFLDQKNLSPDTTELTNYLKICEEYSFAEIPFAKTRLAEIYHLTKANYEYAEKVAQNKLLPQLDVVGTITRKAQDTGFAKAAGKVNDTDYYIGLSASFPLENNAAESEMENSRIAVEEISHEYNIALNAYKKNISTLANNAGALKKMIEFSRRRVLALESKYRTEEKKYLQARLDLTFLISTGQTLTTERLNLLRLQKTLVYHLIDHQDLTRKK